MPYYLNVNIDGLITADSLGDGSQVKLIWATAYPTIRTNKIAYNIYMSSSVAPIFESTFFLAAPSFISIDGSTNATIIDLTPGEMYHFAVRAFEYDPATFNINNLPIAYNNLRTLPQSLLRSNITSTDLIIPLVDSDQFLSSGRIRLGAELINYTSVDTLNNNLVLSNISQRGVSGTYARPHTIDGYDGYHFSDPHAIFWLSSEEEQNTRVFECWNRFDVDHWSYTTADGYRQKTRDLLNTDLNESDAYNAGFPSYDFSGYHRTDPVLLLNGTCIGSYFGGEYGCVDGYNGVGVRIRGQSVQDTNTQRQEVLLSTTGEPVVLMKRRWTGITCRCMLPNNEFPDARCGSCLGGGIVISYEQYFNPRRADGRIIVRFDPAVDSVKATSSGLESDLQPTSWTLVVPAIHNRDFLVRFDVDQQTPEFRYEVNNVTRNKLFLDQFGAQKFALQRVRKTDIIYQVPVVYDTSTMPRAIYTSFSASPGIPNHRHTLIVSEKITSINQINQITSVDAGHSHTVRAGQVIDGHDLPPGAPGIGHQHIISLT